MKLPTDLILDCPLEENHERSLPEFVEDLREKMDRVHKFAREKLKMQSDKIKQRLDTTSTETAFEPGDAVWLYAPKRTKGRSPKLGLNLGWERDWEGPYTIIKKINDLVYRIQISPRSKPKVVHLERLTRYTGHNPPDWFVFEDPPSRTEDSAHRPRITDRTVDFNRPNIVMINKQKRRGIIIDIAVPLPHNIQKIEKEKIAQYKNL
ncbi:hypothetical protein NQ318_007602 [Aromia moschata]|uniref:Integrase p58-like C-terminal domain-containing protein n=1 Tax=Aromia moschata TaxID=1265417 RepID=A0AAV8YAZ7_9CUCU|nr:hypothetical protein NQ318_007602 [Aromia moschata]